jgi:alpha-L-fucosidase
MNTSKKRKRLHGIILLLFISAGTFHKLAAQERYKATWESLSKYQTPDWFRDAKFGIFIHWVLIRYWLPVL